MGRMEIGAVVFSFSLSLVPFMLHNNRTAGVHKYFITMPSKRDSSTTRVGKVKRTSSSKGKRNREEELAEDMVVDEAQFEDDYDDVIDDGEVVDMHSDEEGADEEEEQEDPERKVVFRPGVDEMPEGAEMTYDSSAYDMYHKLAVDWPCLSFDIVTDTRGASRTKYPLTCYWACGSQAANGEENYIGIMKSAQLCRTRYDNAENEDDVEEDDDEDEDEDLDMDPTLESKFSTDPVPFNRVRAMPQQPTIIAGWSESGVVKCFDFSDQFKQLDNPAEWVRENAESQGAKAGAPPRNLFTTPHGKEGHTTEGFGLGWSPLKRGTLASGDNEGHLRVWSLTDTGTVASTSLTGKAAPGSIEDIKWSTVQENVLITALSGGSCQVYDARAQGAKLTWTAAQNGVDVNVLDWNPHTQSSHLVATGSDDGSFFIWDLRKVGNPAGAEPVQTYTFLNAPVTSIEWSPTNENLLAVASDDNQVTLWDFSIERDREEELAMAARHPELARFPAQLVFQHMGLKSPKELHWHPQLPGVVIVTDENGFDIFRPSNWKSIIR
eukprot:TRINITY_DN225_c0_g1_i1.p1 TRINITY_DN225_c0_g1~~TRINITY_DN225_c0_g1_i1.p1  ORF type:complete len:550 (+),score=155.40 TRINITY_DN225_c0_g1_i1:2457-4106(+)